MVMFSLNTHSKMILFSFFFSGTAGSGVIGTRSVNVQSLETHVTSISFVRPDEEGDIVVMLNQTEQDFFPFTSPMAYNSSNFVGVPFIYDGVDSEALSPVSLSCSSDDPIDMVVIVSDEEHEAVDATVTHTLGSDEVHVELKGGAKSIENLRAQSLTGENHNPFEGRHLRAIKGGPDDIWLQKQSSRSLKSEGVGCTLIQMSIHDSFGKEVPKTLVVCSEFHDSFRSRKLQEVDQNFRMENTDITIDDHGDVVFRFAGLEDLELLEIFILKLDARIGIIPECRDEPIEVVDMSAVQSWIQPTLVVNGGWFRRAAKIHNINCGWEPAVLDAIATDPNAKHAYGYLARLDRPTTATIMKDSLAGRNLRVDELSSRRKLLRAPPSKDELAINEEMTRGRKPEVFSNSSRKLQGGKHKKILVHGYCDTKSDFPISHFTDAVQFTDPDSSSPKPRSWSNDEFARKIHKFALRHGIHGCGVVGHSQAGMAALHLKENYWSCLDNATSGSRLIQSVGTPYQGTILAGSLAAVGGVFGIGCGYNYDLTESGARKWLRSISSSTRKDVYYYLTGAPTGWWTTPCLYSADLIIKDAEDGVVNRGRGQLPGGNNAGYTSGQCHTDGMHHGNQCSDMRRNNEMNSKAKY